MKQVFLMSIITIILSACQTLGFIEINPKEPTKLNKNYDNFAEDFGANQKQGHMSASIILEAKILL